MKKMRQAAAASLDAQVKAGALAYRRERHLEGLVRGAEALPGENEAEHTRRIIGRLRNALRAERARARAGHWTYDLNRHIALKAALTAECERLSSHSAEKQSAGAKAGA
ncbi:DUF6477 family protein [Afifella sp. IM 167]|uniref:DUF6477 family protein n=1 Tax=Afifella sp. IM 167 TaxID=2033586 RepID=UPI001CCBB706|nr:DUF6477 family protein [Afifella sp. IM 167]